MRLVKLSNKVINVQDDTYLVNGKKVKAIIGKVDNEEGIIRVFSKDGEYLSPVVQDGDIYAPEGYLIMFFEESIENMVECQKVLTKDSFLDKAFNPSISIDSYESHIIEDEIIDQLIRKVLE